MNGFYIWRNKSLLESYLDWYTDPKFIFKYILIQENLNQIRMLMGWVRIWKIFSWGRDKHKILYNLIFYDSKYNKMHL